MRSKRFAPETLALLAAYAWPGNLRGLKNPVERMAVLTAGDVMTAESAALELRRRKADGTRGAAFGGAGDDSTGAGRSEWEYVGCGADAEIGTDEFAQAVTSAGDSAVASLDGFEFGSFAEAGGLMIGVDIFEQAGEHASGADFHPVGDTCGDEEANGVGPADGAGDLIDEAGAGGFSGGGELGGRVLDEGDCEIGEVGGGEVCGETELGRFHEGAMEGGADGEEDDAFGSGGFCEFHGAGDGANVAGDDDLVGRVEIGGGDDFA